VDAFPGQVFSGEVGKVRLNATMTQNVVTYTVEVLTDNSSGKLLPYLTANVKFEVGDRKDVLLVPNAALRWLPQAEQVAPEFRQTGKAEGTGVSSPGKPSARVDKKEPAGGVVWLPQGALVRPLKVTLGLTDGSFTEVENPELKDGLPVVVGEIDAPAKGGKPAAGGSPFTPQLFRGSAQPKGK
jgi:HlyD family secretion protein